MKKLTEIKVNATQLKLIIGETINYQFPKEVYFTGVGKEKTRTLPEVLATIIKTSDWANKRSHDERFDNKHPVELAVDSIRERGLNKSIIAAIRNNYECQKKKQIIGKWKILCDVITEDHKQYIENILAETHSRKVEILPNHYTR